MVMSKTKHQSRIKPGTHQADANELAVTKAGCVVGSFWVKVALRQSCTDTPSRHSTPDGQIAHPFCACVRRNAFLYQQVAGVLCTGLPAEQPIRMIRWPDWPMSYDTDLTCRIDRKKADEDQLQPMVRVPHWENKNGPTAYRQLGVLCSGFRSTKLRFVKTNVSGFRYKPRGDWFSFAVNKIYKIHRRWPTANESKIQGSGKFEELSDRVVGDSSYCKIMQCEASCHRFIMQREQSS